MSTPMTKADLQARIRAIQDTFALNPDELGIAAAAPLFTEHLTDGRLTVTGASGDAENLTVSGSIALPGVSGALTVLVTFRADETSVTGLRVDATLPGWEVPEQHLKVNPGVFRNLGGTRLHLVLSAEANVQKNVEVRPGLGVEIVFDGGHTAYLTGLAPDASPLPQFTGGAWTLAGEFAPVPLTGVGDLARLTDGKLTAKDFDLPPEVKGKTGSLALTALSVTVAVETPQHRGVVMGVMARVGLDAPPIEVLPTLSVSDLYAEFRIFVTSGTPSARLTLGGTLMIGTEVRLTVGISVEASGQGLRITELSAGLVDPVSLKKVFANYLPDVEVPDVTVQRLTFLAGREGEATNLQFLLDIGTSWTLVRADGKDLVVLSEVVFEIDRTTGAGGSTTGYVEGSWRVGEGTVRVRAEHDGQKWVFTGIADNLSASDALAPFGVTDPPPVLTEVKAQRLLVSADSKGESFVLTFLGTLPLGVGSTLAVDVRLTKRAGSGYDLSLTGKLHLVLALEGGKTRTLDFEVTFENTESKQFTGHWSDTVGFSADDLARTFGLDWPPELEQRLPKVTVLDLYYDLTPKAHEYVVHATVDRTQLVLASAA